jgi:hypothetical protein
MQQPQYAKKTTMGQNTVEAMWREFLAFKKIDTCPNDKRDLDSLFCEFWPSVRQTNGQEFRASTMLTMRQNLRSRLLIKFVSVDIICDPEFKSSNTVFNNYLRKLKNDGLGFVKHYPDIHRSDISKVVERLSPDIPQQLQWLSWLYVMLFYCKRGMENITSMKKDHLSFKITNGQRFIRNDQRCGTKNHKETNEDAEKGGYICEVRGHSKCPLKTLEKYVSKLNPANPFLWQYQGQFYRDEDPIWFTNRKIGHTVLSKFMQSISKFCKLEVIYTNHSLRATSCTILGEIGFSDLDVRAVSQHKSVSSLGIYKRTKPARLVEMSQSLSHAIGIQEQSGREDACDTGVATIETGPTVHIVPTGAPAVETVPMVSSMTVPTVSIMDMLPPANSASSSLAKDDNQFGEIESLCQQNDVSSRSLIFRPQLQNCTNITFHFNFHK